MERDAESIWSTINAIYDAFLVGDRSTIDSAIDEDATVWDSSHAPLLRGKRELDAVRDARPSDGHRPTELVATDPVIDVWGDVALARHVLVARYEGQADQRIRNTSAWRRKDARWVCVHNHEDLLE